MRCGAHRSASARNYSSSLYLAAIGGYCGVRRSRAWGGAAVAFTGAGRTGLATRRVRWSEQPDHVLNALHTKRFCDADDRA